MNAGLIPTVITVMNTVMNTENSFGILRVMQAFDSLFPVGAFTMSNGMETYTQKNIVKDTESLFCYMQACLYAMKTNDLGFAAKSALGHDIAELDEICDASKIPSELRNGSRKMCTRFIKTQLQIGRCEKLQEYSELISQKKCAGHYSIAAGLFISDTGADKFTALQMFCYSQLSSLVNHAVKLVPLRQNDGQTALAGIIPCIPDAVSYSMNLDLYDLGISGAGFDLRSMQHEKLYSRIYIS